LPLIERKKRLKAIVPASPSFFFYVDHIEEKGKDLFALACANDLEGIVAKPKQAPYDAKRTKWFKLRIRTIASVKADGRWFNSFMGYNDVAHVRQLTKGSHAGAS
jgi:ATP-dependent DNA ligase